MITVEVHPQKLQNIKNLFEAFLTTKEMYQVLQLVTESLRLDLLQQSFDQCQKLMAFEYQQGKVHN
jgi:F0F1-type ATP synthase delta subunit